MRIRKEDDLLDEELEFIAAVSDALAHPARLRLFRYVMQENRGMRTVCNRDLVETFGYAQATISQHMKKLAQAGLVETRKQDKRTCYYANFGALKRYLDLTQRYALE